MKTVRRLSWIRFLSATVLLLLLPGAVVGGFSLLLPRMQAEQELPGDAQAGGEQAEAECVVVLDPGHGGADGGALGPDGVLEKDLNLSMALQLKAILQAAGIRVIMTREIDTMLDSSVSGGKKMKDLSARLEVMKNYPEALFVSIHMNRFPSEKCRGTQVWYAPSSAEAKSLADAISGAVREAIQPENHRLSKEADDAIFLLYRASSCAVLVECGFLSCPEEAALLQDSGYRDRLACAIARGILNTFALRELQS
jgi:N-acetylmuramoyl-L-alanine amidase